jgi:hypothetical protein
MDDFTKCGLFCCIYISNGLLPGRKKFQEGGKMIHEVEIICAFCETKGKAKADVPDEVKAIKAVCPKCQAKGKHIEEDGKMVPHTDGVVE